MAANFSNSNVGLDFTDNEVSVKETLEINLQCKELDTPFWITVDRSTLDDIMSTAFEGGINYWCGSAAVVDGEEPLGDYTSEQISRGGTLVLTDLEDEEEKWILNLPRLLNGIRLTFVMMMNEDQCIADDIKDFNNLEDLLDLVSWDSVYADMFVQYALFGELVFS